LITEELGYEIICDLYPLLEPEPYLGQLEKHVDHDQSTHGSWAVSSKVIGGAGKDISNELDKIFADPNLQKNLEAKREAQLDAGFNPGDVSLEYIADLQGFSNKPKTTETIKELDELEKSGDYISLYRGVSSFSQESYRAKTFIDEKDANISFSAKEAHKNFYDGDYYGGHGVFGNGTYTSTSKQNASNYASVLDESEGVYNQGVVMKILIPKSVKIAPEKVVKEVTSQVLEFWTNTSDVATAPSTHRNETGRRLMSMGYQAFQPPSSQGQPDTFVILDRSSVIVSKEPSADFEGFYD
jgi:hypothetical protein